MRRLPRTLLPGAFLLVTACATGMYDVRLESVRPAAGMRLPSSFQDHDPLSSGGVVAEFSSRWDLRREVARFGYTFFTVAERCAGRTHIDYRRDSDARIGAGDFSDDLGVLVEAGSGTFADPKRIAPAEGEARDGRFFFRLPIYLQTYGEHRSIGGGRRINFHDIAYDLRRDTDDLCVFARGATLLGEWRTNTVVIPHDAIRAALDSSTAR